MTHHCVVSPTPLFQLRDTGLGKKIGVADELLRFYLQENPTFIKFICTIEIDVADGSGATGGILFPPAEKRGAKI